MGISGLLPLLKPIHVNKHLSEYSGQTIAVDAYVWLHRGAYACAAELVTGKRTNKYVDYAMHRVRLLRHHNIKPYVVFDGGPLPAKRGTESDRKKKRDENLARANALAAQGKHSQAREFYVKCVDVTPQMAYQLIKALKAESVDYVVAPYEADAQMAYLERVGLVHGILTEDSDLLVFGCKTVLLKLDAVESTVVSISREDFASLASTSGGGISLLGWSDVEFRTMAILSGCDYLPSIPGIGLKTAWSLLRKHKTAENVVRALRMEGKKGVPKGYLEAFKLAEKVFLHQRVYDPVQKLLVNLTAIPPQGWDDEAEAYVGE
ncbi:PIN domain-like protein [Cytidiella melzeri]|nr:PIN domain-like protein [Cytidiella melzeri]